MSYTVHHFVDRLSVDWPDRDVERAIRHEASRPRSFHTGIVDPSSEQVDTWVRHGIERHHENRMLYITEGGSDTPRLPIDRRPDAHQGGISSTDEISAWNDIIANAKSKPKVNRNLGTQFR